MFGETIETWRNFNHRNDPPERTISPRKVGLRPEVRAAYHDNPLVRSASKRSKHNPDNDFMLSRMNALRINRDDVTAPILREVQDVLRGKVVETKIRTKHGQITGRTNAQPFAQHVEALTAVAGRLAASKSEDDRDAFLKIIAACPETTIPQLEQSYRMGTLLRGWDVAWVLPQIARDIKERNTDVATQDLATAGASLFALWMKSDPSLQKALANGFSRRNLEKVDESLKTMRDVNLTQSRDIIRETSQNAGRSSRARRKAEVAARAEITQSTGQIYTTSQLQTKDIDIGYGLPEGLKKKFFKPIQGMMENGEDVAVETAAMICAGLMNYGITKAKDWEGNYETLSLILQLAGAGISLSPVAAPVGLAFIVGDALAHHYVDKKATSVLAHVNRLRTRLLSTAYDINYQDYMRNEVMALFDMAMGGMGFWPVYDSI